MNIWLLIYYLITFIADSSDYRPNSRLHKICWEGNLEALDQLKPIETANVNIKNFLSMTPLHIAAMRGHSNLVKPLMLLKADINIRADLKQTPMHFAAENGETSAVHQLIVWGGISTLKNEAKMTPLHLAIQNGHASTVDIFFKQHTQTQIKAPGEKTLLHLAAEFGHDQIIKDLIGFGMGIDVLDSFQRTPLHLAAANGHISTVELLMDLNIDPMTKDFADKTVIDHAKDYGHHELAQKIHFKREKLKFASLISSERNLKTVNQESQGILSTSQIYENKNSEDFEHTNQIENIPEELLQRSIESLYASSAKKENDGNNQEDVDDRTSVDATENRELLNSAILSSEENRKSKKLPPLGTSPPNTGFFVTDMNTPNSEENDSPQSVRIDPPETDHQALSRIGTPANVKVDMSRVHTPQVLVKDEPIEFL